MKINNVRLFKVSVLLYAIFLFSSLEATARGIIFVEKAYIKLGIGAFQADAFKEMPRAHKKKKLKTSHAFNVGVGYKFSDYIRADVDFYYTKLYYKFSGERMALKQNVKVVSSMMNLYCDLYTGDFIAPYIKVGLGVSRNSPSKLVEALRGFVSNGKNRTNFSWDAGGGVLLDTISKDYSIDIGYRYVDFGKMQTQECFSVKKYVFQRIKGHLVVVAALFKL
jgi:opacity protein-like surface antigen